MESCAVDEQGLLGAQWEDGGGLRADTDDQLEWGVGHANHPIIQILQIPVMIEDCKIGHPHERSTGWVLPCGCCSGIDASPLLAICIPLALRTAGICLNEGLKEAGFHFLRPRAWRPCSLSSF